MLSVFQNHKNNISTAPRTAFEGRKRSKNNRDDDERQDTRDEGGRETPQPSLGRKVGSFAAQPRAETCCDKAARTYVFCGPPRLRVSTPLLGHPNTTVRLRKTKGATQRPGASLAKTRSGFPAIERLGRKKKLG